MGMQKIREPRGSMVIVDRGFDMISPVIHEFFYQTNVYDSREISEDGKMKTD